MSKKVVSALGNDLIKQILEEEEIEFIDDIPYQDGILELLKREFIDILIVSPNIEGEENKYRFIERIKEIDSKIKIIVILPEEDNSFKEFLYMKEIINIFIEGKNSIEELKRVILKDLPQKRSKLDLNHLKLKFDKECGQVPKSVCKRNLMMKFQKQQVLSFIGTGSTGKSTIAVQMATILAERSKAKVLLIDFDTVNAGINVFFGEKRTPANPGYILPSDKNGGVNYLIDAVDKRILTSEIFEKYIINSKKLPNLDILTGNKSLYIARSILNNEYYFRILEKAKELYDFILIDTPNNMFLDAMQFSILNSNKTFLVIEPTYLSIERANRLFEEVFPVWGVYYKKIRIIVNKYHKKSLDKTIIAELLKDWQIAGYISVSEKYQECLNAGQPYSRYTEAEYIPILENLEFISKNSRTDNTKKLWLARWRQKNDN